MKLIAAVIVSITVLSAPIAWGQDRGNPRCPAEVEEVLRVALEHAFEAKDLPEYDNLTRQGSIYLSNHLSGNECIVDESVLPSRDETYVLVSREELEAIASQRGDIFYAGVGDVQLGEGEVTVWLGASIQPAPQSAGRPLMCCCSRKMLLRRGDEGTWEFLSWTMFLCA
jgi:hypothetical protein